MDDEPKNMDMSKLNELQIDAQRVRSSILDHNDILRGHTGSLVQRDSEVTDLGLGDMTESSSSRSHCNICSDRLHTYTL